MCMRKSILEQQKREEYSEASKEEIIFVIYPLIGLYAIFLANAQHLQNIQKYCVYAIEADFHQEKRKGDEKAIELEERVMMKTGLRENKILMTEIKSIFSVINN